jgi:hypothetical protein
VRAASESQLGEGGLEVFDDFGELGRFCEEMELIVRYG